MLRCIIQGLFERHLALSAHTLLGMPTTSFLNLFCAQSYGTCWKQRSVLCLIFYPQLPNSFLENALNLTRRVRLEIQHFRYVCSSKLLATERKQYNFSHEAWVETRPWDSIDWQFLNMLQQVDRGYPFTYNEHKSERVEGKDKRGRFE